MKYIGTATERALIIEMNGKKINKSFHKPAERIMKVKSILDGQITTLESFERRYIRISHLGFPTLIWDFKHTWDAQSFYESSIYSLIENGYTALDGY